MTIICSVCYDSCQRMFPLQEILSNATKVSLLYTAQIQVLTLCQWELRKEAQFMRKESLMAVCFSIQPLFSCTVCFYSTHLKQQMLLVGDIMFSFSVMRIFLILMLDESKVTWSLQEHSNQNQKLSFNFLFVYPSSMEQNSLILET